MMHLTFVRTVGAHDRIYVRRSDGVATEWTFPSMGNELPHDLVHLVCEAGFAIADGIFAAVDAGLDLAKVNARANKVGGKHKYRGTGLDRPSAYVSEALAAAFGPFGGPDEARLASIAVACRELEVAMPKSVTLERVAEVKSALDRLRTKWRELIPRGSLTLEFDPKAPARSFEEFPR
jgi:hypothetical protein